MTRQGFSIMAFPAGPSCNLNCSYCYYLGKMEYYKNSGKSALMEEDVLERFVQQYIEASLGPYVNFGWQGGEPTLRGLPFFRKAIALQQEYLPPGWECRNSFQTNGVLLDDEWCAFFSENNVLVGVSLDGPERFHDEMRKDKADKGTHRSVVASIDLLKKYEVEFNVLCVVSRSNVQSPTEVYRFFRDLGVEFVQFIPLVESGNRQINDCSIHPGSYGSFLISVFNEWAKNDFGRVFVQIFEEVLRIWAGYGASLCILSETCGRAMVMEHNGDLYSCDHYVSPEYKLGNILTNSISEMGGSEQQKRFGGLKHASLSQECLGCQVRLVCQGGCPKNRIAETRNGEMMNYLCSDYKRFFTYVTPFMEEITRRLTKRHPLPVIQEALVDLYDRTWDAGRNDACPCGSGKKFKRCCM